MKLRVISLLLIIAMALMLMPAPVAAVATMPNKIADQIRSAYEMALVSSGRTNFNGYCGTLVSWQLYSLGIDKNLVICDGNQQFDRYNNIDKTTGGYNVHIYSAEEYTLRSALNDITGNGARDVYNLMVGFQQTNTEAGKIYGHALVIHAIIDGMVYFVECYNAAIGGRVYTEGSPIVCSIEDFCTYYERWTVFEGIAYFGLQSYHDVCAYFPCTMKAMAVADGYLYEEPGDPGVYEPRVMGKLVSGQWMTVTAVLQTAYGNYWYRVEQDNCTRYVEADKLAMGSLDDSGVMLSGMKAPTSLVKGKGFSMTGTILSHNSLIRGVQVSVYFANDPATPVFSGAMEVNGSSVSLNKAQMNSALAFRKLEVGTYELRITAEIQIYIAEGEELSPRIEQVELWRSQFLVVSDRNTYLTVTLDGNGGEPQLKQIVVAKDAAVGDLPAAERSGYAFVGWSLDSDGAVPVTSETVLTKNTTLYAQWTPGHSGKGGWQETNEGWHYCAGESPVEGWIQFGDLQFYQYSDGSLAKGWVWIDNALRYFNDAGAQITHLDDVSGVSYDAQMEGKGTFGWLATGSEPTGHIQITTEEVQQRMERVDNMPAAGKAMQKLSAGLYWLAVKLTSGELPEQFQDALNQK